MPGPSFQVLPVLHEGTNTEASLIRGVRLSGVMLAIREVSDVCFALLMEVPTGSKLKAHDHYTYLGTMTLGQKKGPYTPLHFSPTVVL